MREIYKDIDSYVGLYKISNLGNVKSFKFGKEKILKNHLGVLGYYKISLCKNSKSKSFNIHSLAAKTFIYNPENKPQVNHINGIKQDNKVYNLEWSTAKENIQHAHNIGLINTIKGQNKSLSKLKDLDVLEIRRIGKTKTQLELSIKYNVNQSLISLVINNKIWKHI
jgi:hypothetical protein